MKNVSELTPVDLRQHPVWRFTGSDEPSELGVRPVKKLPVKSLNGSLVGCEVGLACGRRMMALLGNLDAESARLTGHFVTLSLYRDDGKIFHTARYHDVDYSKRGPDALVAFLMMKKTEVFPIAWDIRHLVVGGPSALHGLIEAIPKERLTTAQLIELALP